jgi:hypothetical protein
MDPMMIVGVASWSQMHFGCAAPQIDGVSVQIGPPWRRTMTILYYLRLGTVAKESTLSLLENYSAQLYSSYTSTARENVEG